MRNLLRADLSRLKKDNVFLLSCAVMFIAGVMLPVIHYIDNIKNAETWTPDSSSLIYIIIASILLSFVSALFAGSGYSDGTVRNKITAGHKRYHVYLSNMITCSVSGIIMCISYALPHLLLGSVLLGKFTSDPKELIICFFVGFSLIIAFSALYTLISMLCTNKAYSVTACILLVFALLLWGIRITSALNEPEYYSAYSYTENGVTIEAPAEKNPNYLSGNKRKIYEFLNDFTPGGQVLKISNNNVEKPAVFALYDLIITVVSTGFGIVFFKRKDLK